MKLQPDRFDGPSISAYGAGWVRVASEKITSSVVIGSDGQRLDWAGTDFDDLNLSHFTQLAQMNAELVILGSGQTIRFPHSALLTPLMSKRIGLETMDTQAACRTYNILASEGRKVVVALLLG
ncbi:MAG: Mth938-like domain-containing protein [Burkholderiaceae bacterium]